MGIRSLAVTAVLLTGLARQALAEAAGIIVFGPPAVPKVLSLTMSGNGCPSAAAENRKANWNEWTFNFSNFTATDHETVAARDRNANCQIYISIASGPLGWQVAVKALTVRSAAFLSPGSSLAATGSAAAFLVAASDDGVIPRATRSAEFTNDGHEDVAGPVTVRFDFSDGGPWSDCMAEATDENAVAGVINVNFRVGVRKTISEGRAAFGVAAAEAINANVPGSVVEQLEWTWRRCTPPTPTRKPTATRTSRPSQTPNPPDEGLPPEEGEQGDEYEFYPTVGPEASSWPSTGIVISTRIRP